MTRSTKVAAAGRLTLRSAGKKKSLRMSSPPPNQTQSKKKVKDVTKPAAKSKVKKQDSSKAAAAKDIYVGQDEDSSKSATASNSAGDVIRRSSRQATKERKVWTKVKPSATPNDDDNVSEDEDSSDNSSRSNSNRSSHSNGKMKRKRKVIEDASSVPPKSKVMKYDKGEKAKVQPIEKAEDDTKNIKRGRGRPRKSIANGSEGNKTKSLPEGDSKENDNTTEDRTEKSPHTIADVIHSSKDKKTESELLKVTDDVTSGGQIIDKSLDLGKNDVSITSQIIRESLMDSKHTGKSIIDLKSSEDAVKSATSGSLSSKARLIFNKPPEKTTKSSFFSIKNRFPNRNKMITKPLRTKPKNWKEIISGNNYPSNKGKLVPEKKKIGGVTEQLPVNLSTKPNKNPVDLAKLDKYLTDDSNSDDAASSILRKFRLSGLRTEKRTRKIMNDNTALREKNLKASETSSSSSSKEESVSPTKQERSDESETSVSFDSPNKYVNSELFANPVHHIPELSITSTINKLKERVNKSYSGRLYNTKLYRGRHMMGKKLHGKPDEIREKPIGDHISKNENKPTKEQEPILKPTNITQNSKDYSPSDFSQKTSVPLETPMSPEVLEEGKVSLKAALAELLMESEHEANHSKQTLTIHSAPKTLGEDALFRDGEEPCKEEADKVSVDQAKPAVGNGAVEGEKPVGGCVRLSPASSPPPTALHPDHHRRRMKGATSPAALGSPPSAEEDELIIVSSPVKSPPHHSPLISEMVRTYHLASPVVKHLPSLVKMPFKPLSIKTPLKCPICPMQFCTVRSLLWHFGQHENNSENSNGNTQLPPLPSPLLEDLKMPWTRTHNDENTKPLHLFQKFSANKSSNVFSGVRSDPTEETASKTSIPRQILPKVTSHKAGELVSNAKKSGESIHSLNSKLKMQKRLEPTAYSSKSLRKASLTASGKSRITGSNLKNNPFLSVEKDTHIISHNTPLAATSTGVVATILGNHSISDVTEIPSTSGKSGNAIQLPAKKLSSSSSAKKKNDVILKIPIPRLNKSVTSSSSTTALPTSPLGSKTKFVNILPKVSAINQPVNLSMKDNTSHPMRHNTTSTKLTSSSLATSPSSSCGYKVKSASQFNAASVVGSGTAKLKLGLASLRDDSIVMINPNLGLRIVSTVGSTSGSIAMLHHERAPHFSGSNTTTNTVNVKPIMSSTVPSKSNTLTIVPNSGRRDSLTIVPQNSKEAAELKRNEEEVKTPDILTIVPQIDSKVGKNPEKQSTEPPARIMTAAGQMSPSHAVNLVLVNQSGGMRSPTRVSKASSPLKSPKLTMTAMSSPRPALRGRTFTSDAEDSEDDKMIIDDQSFQEEESGHDSSVDPITVCSVSIDADKSGTTTQSSPTVISNGKLVHPLSPKLTTFPPAAMRSIPNLTPICSSPIRTFRPIAPICRPPITFVPLNSSSTSLLPQGRSTSLQPTFSDLRRNSSPGGRVERPSVAVLSPMHVGSAQVMFSQLQSSTPTKIIVPSSPAGALKLQTLNISSPAPLRSVVEVTPSPGLTAPNLPTSLVIPNLGNVVISAKSVGAPVSPRITNSSSSAVSSTTPARSPRGESSSADSATFKRTVEMDTGKYNKRKYVCKYCNRRFGWSTDLKRHTILHTGEKPFQCPVCKTAFTRKFLLQNHIRRIHKEDALLFDPTNSSS